MVLRVRVARKGRRSLLWQQRFWIRQMIPGLGGRYPGGLSSGSEPLPNEEVWQARNGSARPTEWVAGEKLSGKSGRQELLQMALRGPSPKSSLSDDPDSRIRAGCEMGMAAETVSKLCQQGELREAIEALEVLVETDSPVTKSLFYIVLQKCIGKKNLGLGRKVHGLIAKKGYHLDTFLCNHILRMYASHARMQEAMDVFTLVPNPDAFMWSSIISAHVKHGQAKQAVQLYRQMCSSSVKPDDHVFLAALQACARAADLKTGQRVHADLVARGGEPRLFVSNALVDMYAKCGSLEDAQKVFDSLPQKTVVTWTAMIAGYSQQGKGQEALTLYTAMQREGVATPDSVTFVCLLQACASVGTSAMGTGKQLHRQIEDEGLQGDVVVGCSLVNMYAKCGGLEDAQRVFDKLPQKSTVTWTALIAAYSQKGMGQEALHLYSAMQEEGIAAPDSVTFVCLLQACAIVGAQALEKGKQLHAQIRDRGILVGGGVGCSLVNMYAKCGSLEDAQSIFDKLSTKTVVTWNALIAGYSQQGMGHEALRVYTAMQDEGLASADAVTFACLLQACANVAALHWGRHLHAQIEEQGLQSDEFVAISLINMYAKCGSMVDALQVFDSLQERDVVAWNALIAGYTRQGDSEVVFQLFHKMQERGIQPTGVTFLSLLTVCSHAGLVDEGKEYLDSMTRQYAITPTTEHYSCMVDLLGRAGHLDAALAMVKTMPVDPDDTVWRILLGACQKWSNVDLGRHAFDEAVKLNTKGSAPYVLMSNIYINAQMWEEAEEMQARRTKTQAWKQPGQSWWTDMDGIVHSFVVGDLKLKQLGSQIEPSEMMYAT